MTGTSPAELKAYAKDRIASRNLSVPFPLYERQLQTESGWRHYNDSGEVLTSYTGVAKGVGQLSKNVYSPAIWSDPWKNIDASLDTMQANYLRTGSWRKALAGYNWGMGNVLGYTNSEGVHPAWDGSRAWTCPVKGRYCDTKQMHHYLDSILGPEWDESQYTSPANTPPPVVEKKMPDDFQVFPDMRSYMESYGDSPASNEVEQKDPQGRVQAVLAWGQSGACYTWVAATGKRYRFLPD